MNESLNRPPFDPHSEPPPSSVGSGVIDRPSSRGLAAPAAAEQTPTGAYEDVLFRGLDAEQFKLRWHEIQGAFVDSPQQAVKRADELVCEVVDKLESEFSSVRAHLEQAWAKDAEPSTEDLRKALQRYRSFFNRLLSL